MYYHHNYMFLSAIKLCCNRIQKLQKIIFPEVAVCTKFARYI